MKPSLVFLALLTSTIANATAADKPPVVELADLDRPPERLEFRPVAITEALKQSGADDTVTMTAIVSTEGRVDGIEDVKAASPAAAEAATQSAKGWVFAPAFSKGQPVMFRLPVAIAIRLKQVPDAEADSATKVGSGSTVSTAESTFETIPEYPEPLRSAPVDGYAVVTLFIDQDGKASDPVVELASRPEYSATAAAEILKWTFSPAVRDGQPFAARASFQVPFLAKSATWTPVERDLQARLAYVRSYDEAPRQKKTVPVIFPYEALISNKQGGITLNVIVGPDGRVARVVPGPGADADYLGAAHASLAWWEFDPALKAGQPVFAMIAMQLNFDPHRHEFEYDSTTFELIKGLRDGTAEIFSLKQVDQMPRPVNQVTPVFPPDYEGGTTGEAMIEFIIDKTGRTQLPRVVRASSPQFGWSAATAAAQWRFEPARKDGEPVTVRARQPIKVVPDTPAAP